VGELDHDRANERRIPAEPASQTGAAADADGSPPAGTARPAIGALCGYLRPLRARHVRLLV